MAPRICAASGSFATPENWASRARRSAHCSTLRTGQTQTAVRRIRLRPRRLARSTRGYGGSRLCARNFSAWRRVARAAWLESVGSLRPLQTSPTGTVRIQHTGRVDSEDETRLTYCDNPRRGQPPPLARRASLLRSSARCKTLTRRGANAASQCDVLNMLCRQADKPLQRRHSISGLCRTARCSAHARREPPCPRLHPLD